MILVTTIVCSVASLVISGLNIHYVRQERRNRDAYTATINKERR